MTDTTSVRRWPSTTAHPIAPTEFPKGRSAATTRSVPGGDNHEAVTYTPQEEDTKGRSHRRIDGYRLWLTPRNLIQNPSQGPIIHRPHPYRGAESISDFSHPSPPLTEAQVVDLFPGWNRQATVQP